MRLPGAYGCRRWLAALVAAASLTLAGLAYAAPAMADGDPAITGIVEDTSSTPQGGVTINVINPATDAMVLTTFTLNDGSFSASVASGTYNIQFIPPSATGLQSYLATGVSTDSAPLTVILKTATVVQVQGSVTDNAGNAYPGARITFNSPLNPGNQVQADSSGNYSATLLADQNFTADIVTNGTAYSDFSGLPIGTLDHSQTYNIVLPTAQLTVSVRDQNGNPITGGTFQYNGTELSPLPGLPGASVYTYSTPGAQLDANGNTTLAVPAGITLSNPRIVLSNGLVVPATVPVMNGDRSVTVIVPASIQVQGSVTDNAGNAYPGARITFNSPLNPGNQVQADSSGNYSATLLADQNFTADIVTNGTAYSDFSGLPIGTLDHSQTYNIVLPTAQLTVSVRDQNGNPITGGTFQYNGTELSPLPGLPGASVYTYSTPGAQLDANGNTTLAVPAGITLSNPRIVLSNGLVIPFMLHPISADRHAYIIFNATTGAVLVDDQPPVVTGSPDRAPNRNGWYKAPVTITWASVDPAPSSGTPTTPSPTTLSTEGASQTVTSGKSCDPAGNCATGSVTGLNLDMTPPSVSVTGVTSGTAYTGGVTLSPACSTSDSLSGVAANATLSVINSGINYTATCSGATDNAGNTAAPVSVQYQVIPAGWTTASLSDSDGNPISGASVIFRSAGGSVTSATTGSDGTAGVALTPGSYSVTMYYATGYQTKTITVAADGPNSVSFATVAVTAQISDPSSTDLASASVSHAGNTGSYGSKTAVDANGEVTFQVLPGTNTFTAWDANCYQTQTATVTGSMTVTFTTVPVKVQITDPTSTDLASASVSHAGNTGTYGPKTAVDANGDVTFQVLPGTNTFTAWDANGYQTQTLTIAGQQTVTFTTDAVTITVLKNGSPLTTATVAHAGNTGTYGPKAAVDANGQVTFHVLPGTNIFTAWDGTAYQTVTLTVTGTTSTTITVP